MPEQILSLQFPLLMPIKTASDEEDISIFEIPIGRTQIQKRGLKSIKGVGVSLCGDRLVGGRFQLQVNGQIYIDTVLRKGLHSFGCNKMLANQYSLPEIRIDSSLGIDSNLGIDGEIIISFLPLKVASDGSGVIGYEFSDNTRTPPVPKFYSNAVLLAFAESLENGNTLDIAVERGNEVAMLAAAAYAALGNSVDMELEGENIRIFLNAISITVSTKSTDDNDNIAVILHIIS